MTHGVVLCPHLHAWQQSLFSRVRRDPAGANLFTAVVAPWKEFNWRRVGTYVYTSRNTREEAFVFAEKSCAIDPICVPFVSAAAARQQHHQQCKSKSSSPASVLFCFAWHLFSCFGCVRDFVLFGLFFFVFRGGTSCARGRTSRRQPGTRSC